MDALNPKLREGTGRAGYQPQVNPDDTSVHPGEGVSAPGSESSDESKVGGEAQTVRLYMGMSGESRVERFAGSDPMGPCFTQGWWVLYCVKGCH